MYLLTTPPPQVPLDILPSFSWDPKLVCYGQIQEQILTNVGDKEEVVGGGVDLDGREHGGQLHEVTREIPLRSQQV